MKRDELLGHKAKIEAELKRAERLYGEAKVNHILHLILSVLTAGLWVLVWGFVAFGNSGKKNKLGNLIDECNESLVGINDQLSNPQ